MTTKQSQFQKALGVIEALPSDQQSDLVEVIRRRLAEHRRDEAAELLPQGSPVPRDFWQSPTIEELALAQNVQPMGNVEVLFGTWPGDEDDDFEAAINELRHQGMPGDALQ